MKTFSKILSIALVLSMVLGFALVGTAATTDSYEKVTTLTDGQYILVASVSNNYYVAGGELASDGKGFTYTKLSAAPGATLTGVDYEPLTVTVSGTTATLKLANGKYVIPASSGNNLTIGTTATSWNVSVANGEVTFSAPQSGTAKYIAFNSQGYWRYYTDKSSTSGYDQKFEMYKLTTGSTPNTCDHAESKLSWDHDSTQHWKVCECNAYTTTKENHDGNDTCVCGYVVPAPLYTPAHLDKVTIYYPADDCYMSGTASGTKLAAGTAVELIVVLEGGQYQFVTAEGKYLTSGATGNSLTLATASSQYSLWTLEETTGGWYIKNVNAQHTNGSSQYLEYYSGFTTYGLGSGGEKFTFLFEKTGVATEVPEFQCTHVDANTDYICDNGCGENVDPAADTTLTLDVANKLGLAHTAGYTDGKYYVTGVITEIVKADYGNLWIEDADGNRFYIYGIYSADGSTRYDALDTIPGVGDEVTLYGVIGQYSGTAQMKSAWIDEIVLHTCDDDDDHKCDVCDATLTQCADDDDDHKCDVCDATLSQCADDDDDHKCDVCDATLTQCADDDDDHKCDVCDATLSQCADDDGDEKCDVCDADLSTGNADDDQNNDNTNNDQTGDDEEDKEDKEDEEDEPAKTGDVSLISAVILTALSASGMGLVIKKKVF